MESWPFWSSGQLDRLYLLDFHYFLVLLASRDTRECENIQLGRVDLFGGVVR